MAINGIVANLGGDAKAWVAQIESALADAQRQIAALNALIAQLSTRS